MGLLSLLLGYLLGSIPSGYLAGRWCKGIDLRELAPAPPARPTCCARWARGLPWWCL